MTPLKDERCIQLHKADSSLSEEEISDLLPQVPDWIIFTVDGIKRLERTFKFNDFVQALAFTYRVGEISEEQDHHPALLTEWGKVTVTWWTHVVGGLHRNDFIMAAKTDALYLD